MGAWKITSEQAQAKPGMPGPDCATAAPHLGQATEIAVKSRNSGPGKSLYRSRLTPHGEPCGRALLRIFKEFCSSCIAYDGTIRISSDRNLLGPTIMDRDIWQEENARYLAAAIRWLRLLLSAHAGDDEVTAADVEEAEMEMRGAEAIKPPPAFIALGRTLGLSPFEADVLLLCIAREMDSDIPDLCAIIQGKHRDYPTFGLAFSLFARPSWSSVTPDRPLRYWRLIEISRSAQGSLTTSPLRADESIVHYCNGLFALDDRLSGTITPMVLQNSFLTEEYLELPPSQNRVVERIVTYWENARGFPPAVQLLGPDTATKKEVCWQVCRRCGLKLMRLPVTLLPTEAAEIETLAILWERDTLLQPLALYLEVQSPEEDIPKEKLVATTRLLDRSHGFFFVEVRDRGLYLERESLSLEIAKPEMGEQIAVWEAVLGGDHRDLALEIAGQFNLSMDQIGRAVLEGAEEMEREQHLRDILRQGEFDGGSNPDFSEAAKCLKPSLLRERSPELRTPNSELRTHLWQGCRRVTRPHFSNLAREIEIKASWENLVLPPEQTQLLQEIANQVRLRGKVDMDWGFEGRLSRGRGITALFAGESGTGKTMAAEVIAHDLGLSLYRIDLATVVSKYIGETEKHLRRLFDGAEDGGAILFFDEADALFGKRSDVQDSHDRYANIEINYLLQRLEAYRGLAILATNRKTALDKAFMRRLRFVVNFPFPGIKERKAMWEKAFPPETPTAEIDGDRLAKLNLTGGHIHNIAVNAAFIAARRGKEVTMEGVLAAARMEFRKLERNIKEADLRLGEG